MLSDWTHLNVQHISTDKKDNLSSKTDFFYISSSLNKNNDCCRLEQCTGYLRNTRNREKEGNNFSFRDGVLSFYVDLFDTIHSTLYHSFDTGFRIMVDDKDKNEEDENCEK